MPTHTCRSFLYSSKALQGDLKLLAFDVVLPINLHAIEVCSVKGLEIVLKAVLDVKMRDIRY